MENGPGDINTEIVTKMVPVRAVELSIGAFCTGFRCEQLCDDDIFRDRGQLLAIGAGNRCVFFSHAVAIVFLHAVAKVFSHAVAKVFFTCGGQSFFHMRPAKVFFTCGWPPNHIKKLPSVPGVIKYQ